MNRFKFINDAKLNSLQAILPVKKDIKKRTIYWLFLCECGKTKVLRQDLVTSGKVGDCGCGSSKGVLEYKYKNKSYYKNYECHNLPLTVYKMFLAVQENKCAICKKEFTGKICIDHNHNCCSGKTSCGNCVRGLLCSTCNYGLGMFKDNLQYVKNAVSYLEKGVV